MGASPLGGEALAWHGSRRSTQRRALRNEAQRRSLSCTHAASATGKNVAMVGARYDLRARDNFDEASGAMVARTDLKSGGPVGGGGR